MSNVIGRIFGGPLRTVEDDEADQRAAHVVKVRQARLELARANDQWEELPETRLVQRRPGGRYLVDAESDRIYSLGRGIVFEPGRSTVGYVDPNDRMTFYVDRDEEIVFLERLTHPHTWSEFCERQARRARKGCVVTHKALVKIAPIFAKERFDNPAWRRPGRSMYYPGSLKFLPGVEEVPLIVDHDDSRKIGTVHQLLAVDWIDAPGSVPEQPSPPTRPHG